MKSAPSTPHPDLKEPFEHAWFPALAAATPLGRARFGASSATPRSPLMLISSYIGGLLVLTLLILMVKFLLWLLGLV